jgi:hypothetical protein
MTDDIRLSLTDVAEALDCTIHDVRQLIDRGDLRTISGGPADIAYSELARFVQVRKDEQLLLGVDTSEAVEFTLLRPRGD